jgi:hypothetical protein
MKVPAELVEIGAKALSETRRIEDDKWVAEYVLGLCLPELARMMMDGFDVEEAARIVRGRHGEPGEAKEFSEMTAREIWAQAIAAFFAEKFDLQVK